MRGLQAKSVDGCTDPLSGGVAVRCFESLPERRLYTSLPMYFSLVSTCSTDFFVHCRPRSALICSWLRMRAISRWRFPLVNKQMEHDIGHGTAAGWEISRSALLQR